MIDHVSIGVRDIAKAKVFYQAVLGALGYEIIEEKPGTVGFGKKYPDFWLNARPKNIAVDTDNGCHVCLRARTPAIVDKVHSLAIDLGGVSSGKPGYRPEYHESYYACFFRDSDSNHIEVVTFVQD